MYTDLIAVCLSILYVDCLLGLSSEGAVSQLHLPERPVRRRVRDVWGTPVEQRPGSEELQQARGTGQVPALRGGTGLIAAALPAIERDRVCYYLVV